MLISLITPTFNRPERLAKAMASVRGQTYGNWQHIIVDDGDGRGKALADTLADSRIQAFQNPDKGQTPARNFAIRQAKGEIISLLDDDDWYEDPFHFEQVVKGLADKPALVHRHGWVVKEEGDKRDWQIFKLATSAESLRKDNSILTSSIAYPSFFHTELGLFDEAIGGYFDWDWIIRILDAGYPVKTLESPGVCYAIHGGNGSSQIHGERRTRSFQAFCQKHGLELEIKNHEVLLEEKTSL